jgi:hypothetical protein
VGLSDAGNYAVVVSDGQGSNTSDPAILALRPVIMTQPQGQTSPVGGMASFSVVASGTGTLQYHWRHNRVLISGANSALLTLQNLQAVDAGEYSVIVTHQTPLGTLATISSNAVLTVSPP